MLNLVLILIYLLSLKVLEELNLIKKEKEVFAARNQTQDKLLNSKVTKLQDDLNTKETQIKLVSARIVS